MKHFKFSLFIFVFGILLFVPYNTNALGNKVVDCNYQFTNQNDEEIELTYEVYSDGSVSLPFADASSYTGDGRSWYHSDGFSNTFYNIAKLNNSTITCPSIYVQEDDSSVTVYPNPLYRDSCTGKCYNITAATPRLSSWANDTGIEVKRVTSTCTGSSMGFYNRQSYVFPYFRLFSDGTKEWSVDGNTYVPVTDAISGRINSSETFSITVNDSLLDSIYNSSRPSCPTRIYRCVTETEDGYAYELSTSLNQCSRDELSTNDGQEYGSNYYNGAFGDPDEGSGDSSSGSGSGSSDESVSIDDLREELDVYGQNSDCNSILGSTEDENSVAWLLQQLLNYIKILGPMLVVILSSMDFAKAIMASDDENMKKAEKKLMIRLVLAVALFLIPTLVSVLLNVFGITSDQICGLQ